MEKYIKNLSILHLMVSVLFFLSMSGLLLANSITLPEGLYNVLIGSTRVLMFLVPVLFMILFMTSMFNLFKRIMNAQLGIKNIRMDKFPTMWFVLSSISFVIYFLFVNMISMGG